MSQLWQTETGHLACRWYEVGHHSEYNPPWFQETSEMQGSYLPPPPDFASRSPFGRANWFQPCPANRDFE
jgi:hypothetical protein